MVNPPRAPFKPVDNRPTSQTHGQRVRVPNTDTSQQVNHVSNDRLNSDLIRRPKERTRRGKKGTERKRTYDEIADSLAVASKKRQRTDYENLGPLTHLGRFIYRGIQFEADVHMLIKVGVALSEMEGREVLGACEEELDSFNEEQKETILRSFNAMLKHEPTFGEVLRNVILDQDEVTFDNLLDELSEAANNARKDDTRTLKEALPNILAPNPFGQPLNPPVIMSRSKSHLGVNHWFIAALFCPRRHIFRMLRELESVDVDIKSIDDGSDDEEENISEDEEQEDYEEDEGDERVDEVDDRGEDDGDLVSDSELAADAEDESAIDGHRIFNVPRGVAVVEFIQDNRMEITPGGLDAFLYDLRMIKPGKADKDVLQGFLRGYLGPRVYEFSSRGKRPSLAKIHKLDYCTPETIAYTFVQIRFMLSNQDVYSPVDDLYDLRDLYTNIVTVLSTGSKWARSTLRWWNRKCFPREKSVAKSKANPNAIPSSSMFDTLAQREAVRSQRRIEVVANRSRLEEEERQEAEHVAKTRALQELQERREQRKKRSQVERHARRQEVEEQVDNIDSGSNRGPGSEYGGVDNRGDPEDARFSLDPTHGNGGNDVDDGDSLLVSTQCNIRRTTRKHVSRGGQHVQNSRR
ncbi:hypothetical protein K435DRAFT_851713 [Dendrothele bispora CBS 962.96]|uniref:Uncharacterized protein n=1 Tax=Dendrothele bispora (strain CBS 962.96) TaxID=1314807 RepID=A0A4S8MLA5_DENBC|nr:hypothetical protein K435DRAFT_851713 [Dendrothele bispora CBS 962.96]